MRTRQSINLISIMGNPYNFPLWIFILTMGNPSDSKDGLYTYTETGSGSWMKCWQFLMMPSSNGNIFHFTGPLCGESTSHRWIPLTVASDVELWCAPEQMVEQTIAKPLIWDAIMPTMTSLQCSFKALSPHEAGSVLCISNLSLVPQRPFYTSIAEC